MVRGVAFIREAAYKPRGTVFPFGGVSPSRKLPPAERQLALDPRVDLPPPQRPHPSPAILVAVRQREVKGSGAWVLGSRNRGVDERFKTDLLRLLPNATGGRPVYVQEEISVQRFGKLRFRDQLAFMSRYSFFVADEGAHLTWIALANPGATWVTVYDYDPGLWTPNLRYHIRTWLIRRDSRFIAYVITNNEQAGVEALMQEVGRPYEPGIVVIRQDGVTRCNDFESCANELDFSLVVDMRGMYPIGV
jgi:hypothetical protein